MCKPMTNKEITHESTDAGRGSHLFLLFAAQLVFCQPAPMNLGPYTFTKIDGASSTDYYMGNVNNSGNVTFARFDPGNEQIFYGNGGPLTLVANQPTSPGFYFMNGPTIARGNNKVVFRG